MQNNDTFTVLIFLALITLWFYGMYRLFRAIIRRHRKQMESIRQKKEDEQRAMAEAQKQEKMIELVRLRKESAEAEERALNLKRQNELEDQDVLQRSTVTINGRTMSVAEIISDRVAQETGNKMGASIGSAETINMAQVKCIQCGASIEDGSMFCRFCGTKVPDNVFRAEININDPARMKAEELKHEREKKLSYRFTEAQKAIAKNVEAHTEKIRARNEGKRIEYEEKARKEKLEAEEKERKHKEKMAKERRETYKLFAISMIGLAAVILLLKIFGQM